MYSVHTRRVQLHLAASRLITCIYAPQDPPAKYQSDSINGGSKNREMFPLSWISPVRALIPAVAPTKLISAGRFCNSPVSRLQYRRFIILARRRLESQSISDPEAAARFMYSAKACLSSTWLFCSCSLACFTAWKAFCCADWLV